MGLEPGPEYKEEETGKGAKVRGKDAGSEGPQSGPESPHNGHQQLVPAYVEMYRWVCMHPIQRVPTCQEG